MESPSRIRVALIVLNVLLVGGLVVVALKLLPFLGDRDTTEPVRQAVTATVSWSEGGQRAQDRAWAWVADAELVRVEASWYVTPDWRQLALPPLVWGFVYYSPSERMLATVAVEDDDVLWAPPVPIPVVPESIEGFPPAYGPELAWISFKGAGGVGFLEVHPEAEVVFRMQNEASGLVWTIVASEGTSRHQAVIDAQSGTVLLHD